MKHILLVFVALFFAISSLDAKSLKVLTIGNSFADSVFLYLPKIVKAQDDCELKLERANIGGCELDRHWKYICESESDTSKKHYKGKTKTMREMLESDKWNIVTIQQASHKSWIPESYYPFAKNIYDYIKKYAPTAEIVVQQTWSYRSDSPRFTKASKWNIDQTEMYNRLEKNYAKIAKELNVRVIPTGLCVQNARAMQDKPFVNYDPSLLNTLRYPDLPSQAGAVVGKLWWGKNKEGKLVIKKDFIHLNERGRYLQSCLWFGFLFDKDPVDIKFIPQEIDNNDAVFLRKVASKTLKEFKQPRDQK